MKTFFWKDYTVQITKKKVKNTNVRIKREAPKVICMSIPLSASYESGLQALESPHIRHWLKNYERKLKMKSVPTLENNDKKNWKKSRWLLHTGIGFLLCCPICSENGNPFLVSAAAK